MRAAFSRLPVLSLPSICHSSVGHESFLVVNRFIIDETLERMRRQLLYLTENQWHLSSVEPRRGEQVVFPTHTDIESFAFL